MDFQKIFPFWEQLNSEEQNMVSASALPQKMKKGDILHRGCGECSGIVHVAKGQLLGRIIDAVEGAVSEEIVSPCAGLVFSQRSYSPVYPGTLIARIHAQGE